MIEIFKSIPNDIPKPPGEEKKRRLRKQIKENGFPSHEYLQFSPSSKDGSYAIKEKEVWTVYQQERGVSYERKEFSSLDDWIDYVLQEYYPHL